MGDGRARGAGVARCACFATVAPCLPVWAPQQQVPDLQPLALQREAQQLLQPLLESSLRTLTASRQRPAMVQRDEVDVVVVVDIVEMLVRGSGMECVEDGEPPSRFGMTAGRSSPSAGPGGMEELWSASAAVDEAQLAQESVTETENHLAELFEVHHCVVL